MEPLLQSTLLFFAMAFLGLLACRTFARRQIEFAGAPAVPSVLTSRLGFRTGLLAYCLLLITFYLVTTYYWGPLRATMGPIIKNIDWLAPLAPIFERGGESQGPILPWIVALVVTVVFTWDSKYNPFVVLLEGVLDSLQIPDRAVSVFQALKATKFGRLDGETAKDVCADPGISECRPEYFAMDRRELEYRWAHVCYLRFKLLSYLRDPRYQKFFAHKTLQWGAVDSDYAACADEVGLWLQGTRDYRNAIEIIDRLNALKDAHYRLLACFAVTTSRNIREIWDQVSAISGADVAPQPGNLARFIVLFPVTLFFAILAGREVSIAFYHLVVGPDPSIISFDVEKLKFWVGVSFLVYSAPIAAVMLFRIVSARIFPFEARRYWGLYGGAFVLGYASAAMTLPVLSGHVPFHPLSADYWRLIYYWGLIWSLMPGFVTAFVAYRMDSDASCKETPAAVRRDRLVAGLIGGGVALLVSVLGVLDSVTLTPAEGFVVVFTTVAVGAAVGWLARFETT